MGRRLALVIGAVMLAATPAVARAQTPEPSYLPGQPPPDMPAEDGARMAALETEALAAIETGDWARVERLVREGLALEERHYAPGDVRIGASWDWLVRAAVEQKRPAAEIIPLAENRLKIAEAHPEDPAALAAARYTLGLHLTAGGRAAEAVPLMRAAEDWLAGQGPERAESLRTVRIERGRALAASGEKAEAVEVLRAVLDELPTEIEPNVRSNIAWELAVVLIDLQRFAEAVAPLRLVIESSREGGDRYGETVAAYWLAEALRRKEQTAEADDLLMRVVALEASAPVADRSLTLEQVRATLQPLGDRKRGEGKQDEAVAVFRLLVEANRTRPDDKAMLAASLSRMGLSQQLGGDPAAAVASQQEALELWRTVRTAPHPDIATQLEQLGRSQLQADKHLDALRTLGEAANMRAALDQEPTIDVVQDRAEATEQTGRLETALVLRQQVVARLAAETPRRAEALAGAWGDMAHVAYLLQRPVEAEEFYRRGLALATGVRLREVLTTGLAFALVEQGRGDEGEPMQRQVLSDVTARAGPNTPLTALAINDLANLLSRRRDYARAEVLIRDALAIFEAQAQPDRMRIALLKANLGVTISELGRHEEAIVLLAEAYAIRRDTLGAGHPQTVSIIGMIAHEYADLGAYDRAEPLFAQMVRLRETQLGADHPAVAAALQNHAYVLQSAGRYAEAEALMRRAVRIVEAQSQDPRDRIRYNANWGVSLLESDRPTEAMAVFRRAQEGMIERRRPRGDPGWTRSENEAFRFLYRFSVRAAWEATEDASP